MNWLNSIVTELEKQNPADKVEEITVSSGVSPSGKYHLGTLREIMTAEIIARELRRRGRKARHIHVSDDLDIYRKVPAGIPESYSQYLGFPLCDIPAPDGSNDSYADYYLSDLYEVAQKLHLDMDIMRAHERYRSGFYTEAIEKALTNRDKIKAVLEEVSGRELNDQWSPIQVLEGERLKNRQFVSIDTDAKTVTYLDGEGNEQQAAYQDGHIKLDWRIDWPARWWLLGVKAEPFGRDHATKGGSYDTGVEIARQVFAIEPPLPLAYNFVNRTGETKKMSKSAGDTVTAGDLLRMLPAEVVWFFLMRYAPEKMLFFDEGPTLMRLVDEFGELLANPDKTDSEKQLVELCMLGVEQPTVSRVPFTLLVASYQSALKDVEKTLEIIGRTEYADVAREDADTIRRELVFLDEWLQRRAPEDVKFSLTETVDPTAFSDGQKAYMQSLASAIANAPADADGTWFHEAIYTLKDTSGLPPKELFSTLYQAIIAKNQGPRAGWFLSILPREWLIKRLRLEA